jgi:hypothetical protein
MLRWSSARPCCLDVLKSVEMPYAPWKALFPAWERGKGSCQQLSRKMPMRRGKGAIKKGQRVGLKPHFSNLGAYTSRTAKLRAIGCCRLGQGRKQNGDGWANCGHWARRVTAPLASSTRTRYAPTTGTQGRGQPSSWAAEHHADDSDGNP